MILLTIFQIVSMFFMWWIGYQRHKDAIMWFDKYIELQSKYLELVEKLEIK